MLFLTRAASNRLITRPTLSSADRLSLYVHGRARRRRRARVGLLGREVCMVSVQDARDLLNTLPNWRTRETGNRGIGETGKKKEEGVTGEGERGRKRERTAK